MYAMTDDGLTAMGGMFTLDASYKDVPVEALPGFRASNGEVCKLPWHNHVGAAGLATSFEPENPDQSNWMAHVWVRGIDTWEQRTDGSEPNSWFTPFAMTPALCNDDGFCV